MPWKATRVPDERLRFVMACLDEDGRDWMAGAGCDGPNRLWCADLKGWFRTGDGSRCQPLTVTDAFSRYVLGCRSLPRTDGPAARPVFEAAFREFGLPDAIRTDNGSPSASTGLMGLSRLSAWWLRLGVADDRIDPGKPQQNGRHERSMWEACGDTRRSWPRAACPTPVPRGTRSFASSTGDVNHAARPNRRQNSPFMCAADAPNKASNGRESRPAMLFGNPRSSDGGCGRVRK